jgi:hypothetical protein
MAKRLYFTVGVDFDDEDQPVGFDIVNADCFHGDGNCYMTQAHGDEEEADIQYMDYDLQAVAEEYVGISVVEKEPYATSEDNNEEFWHGEDPAVLRWEREAKPVFHPEPTEVNPSYGHWEPSYLDWKQAHMCDECSEVCEDEEDEVKCPDGKIRCATCVEPMYRENGGES